MPRFVLLRHEAPQGFGKRSHWDLMLEREPTSLENLTEEASQEHRLATWNLFELPKAWIESLSNDDLSGVDFPVGAVRLPDHRAHYLDYEGPISNNRGEVQRVTEGEIRWITAGPKQCEVEILAPAKLAGRLILEQSSEGSKEEANWLLYWKPWTA